jgi:hypothetical protein
MNEAIRNAIAKSAAEYARTGKLYSLEETREILRQRRAGDHDAHVMAWEVASVAPKGAEER